MTDINWLCLQFPQLSNLNALNPGGQKEVFSAIHPTEGEVVLKLFHLNANPERALREIQINVTGARVPRIFEVGTIRTPLGEVIWIREERIHGDCLRNLLSKGPLTTRQVLCLGRDILETLAAAENVQIVHRDVKPDNIIIAKDGLSWLIDYGLARHLNLDSLTATGLMFGVGTPGYAPPEQFRNFKHQIDSRADLFGLGVTLYESTEGVNPLIYGARDHFEVLRRTEAQPLPRINRQIDQRNQFADLVYAMTRVQRDHRPLSAIDALTWMKEICTFEGL